MPTASTASASRGAPSAADQNCASCTANARHGAVIVVDLVFASTGNARNNVATVVDLLFASTANASKIAATVVGALSVHMAIGSNIAWSVDGVTAVGCPPLTSDRRPKKNIRNILACTEWQRNLGMLQCTVATFETSPRREQ